MFIVEFINIIFKYIYLKVPLGNCQWQPRNNTYVNKIYEEVNTACKITLLHCYRKTVSCLCHRSLLPVQMSKEEEELVRELLWTLVNNHVFFQHPDLIRILCIHENVIAIMMNSISRSGKN